MAVWMALVLAVVQGVTEFLPISSSAHLILPSQVLGWPDQGLAFDVAVHAGTLTAVCLHYRAELAGMVAGAGRGLVERRLNPDLRLGLLVVWATLPAVVLGFALKDWVETAARSAELITVTTLVFGVVLWVADHRGSRRLNLTHLGWTAALVVGLAQAVALIPGTSRSGITITAALLLGYTRTESARFSFLLSIPVILGAALLKGRDLVTSPVPVDWMLILTGWTVSALTAWLAIVFFLQLIERVGMLPFVIYRLLLGAALLVWLS
jgi:undecaprenyl-diphosphatase